MPFVSWLIRDGWGPFVPPVVPVNSSKPTFASPALFKGVEVGGPGKKESPWIEVQRKTQCSFQCLAGTQEQDEGSSEILSWCLTVCCSKWIKRKIRPSDNQSAGDEPLFSPGRTSQILKEVIWDCFKPQQVHEQMKRHPLLCVFNDCVYGYSCNRLFGSSKPSFAELELAPTIRQLKEILFSCRYICSTY